jgi:hypothetical protein
MPTYLLASGYFALAYGSLVVSQDYPTAIKDVVAGVDTLGLTPNLAAFIADINTALAAIKPVV